MKGSEQSELPKIFNRFTSIRSLYGLVESGKLFFSDPRWWSDRNDSKLLDLYCKKKDVTIRVLCLNGDYESIAFWSDYAEGGTGCCIQFERKRIIKGLEEAILNGSQIRHSKVEYLKLKEKQKFQNLQLDEVPFRKRWPYRYENEYRVIREFEGYGDSSVSEYLEIDITRDITSVTLGPNINKDTQEEIKRELKEKGIKKINYSTVLDSKSWLGEFSHLVGR